MSGLEGKRILVVEDEPFIAMTLEDTLADLQCLVVGPALDVAAGEELARHAPIDAAILDVNVGGRTSLSVAELLELRNIPYILASGYAEPDLASGAGGFLHKPFRSGDVKAGLDKLFDET